MQVYNTSTGGAITTTIATVTNGTTVILAAAPTFTKSGATLVINPGASL